MNYIVMDLEWNQCPDGKENENKKLPFEIIEIGAVKLDSKFNKVDEFSELIKPSVYGEIHYKTKEVIHLNMNELKSAKTFIEVCHSFLKWCGQDYMFATWGSMDLTELQRNMKYYNLKYEFNYPFKYYDIQKVFSLFFEETKAKRTLEYAVVYLNIERNYDFHKAIYDAYYTGKILSLIDNNFLQNNESIDYYKPPMTREEEIYLKYKRFSKYVSKVFHSKEEAMSDREVVSMRCHCCNHNLKKKIKWFSINSKIHYALGFCDEHGYMKCKIRMKKNDDDNYFVIKTIKAVNEEEGLSIRTKREDIRLKRRLKRKNKKEHTFEIDLSKEDNIK